VEADCGCSPLEEFRPTGRAPPRQILDGVLYVLRTGEQWKAMPRKYGSGSTVHRRFQRWVEQGCWETMWRRVLQAYDDDVGPRVDVAVGRCVVAQSPVGWGKKPRPTLPTSLLKP
jgi:transposase